MCVRVREERGVGVCAFSWGAERRCVCVGRGRGCACVRLGR